MLSATSASFWPHFPNGGAMGCSRSRSICKAEVRRDTRKANHGRTPRFDPDGNLRPTYMNRLARVLEGADQLGMVVIVGYFYFGQDQRVKDEPAVKRAATNATNWLLDSGCRNVLVEINNECNVSYHHEVLKPDRVHAF